ncbi:hypothetical protein SAMN02745824_0177 [Parasphingorhabdus marina DSM 22363]|uniref:DUF4412 domain-containing protein n=1 Tax=Parasphingorhabdus marina DSM 22363 TaxID=1123272 RepID=A0A1N6CM44_9SPHN|nr:hypothetical protein [Parasphingorhabdus marina]SIN59648.1 hypothetical protein SAMN02745824_0177 [Parasphingorhabdus marina DSM 22363]
MKRLFCKFAAGLMLGSLATSISAQSETPDRDKSVDQEAETVVIPFAPATGVDMLYEITRDKGDAKIQKMQQKVRFTRSEEGYVMTVIPVAVLINGEMTSFSPFSEEIERMSPFSKEISYDLASDGTILRMRDWEQLKQNLQSPQGGLRSVMQGTTDGDDADAQLAEKVTLFFSRMTSEQAANYFLKDWIPVLGYGGLELELDVDYEADTSMDFGGVPVPAKSLLGLSRDQDSDTLIYFEQTNAGKSDQENEMFSDFEKLMEGMFDGDQEKLEQFQKTMKQLQKANVTQSVNARFDDKTGMPISFEGISSMSFESGENFRRITTITLLSK